MSKSIKVKLPTTTSVQHGFPIAISVNDLSPQDFINLLAETNNHIDLMAKTKFADKHIRMEQLSPQKGALLRQFYSTSPVRFADVHTLPGKKDTLNLKTGKSIIRALPSKLDIQNAYERLGVEHIPFIRVKTVNVLVPDYEVHYYYNIDFQTPDAQTFLSILRDMKENQLLDRLTETVYEALPKQYRYENVWYQIKSLSNLNAEDKRVLNIFKSETNLKVLSFRDNPSAWGSFLSTLPQDTTSRLYDEFVNEQYEKVRDSNNKEISVYEFEGQLYHILSLRQIRDPFNISLKTVYDRVVVSRNEPVPTVLSFRDSLEAWESFLSTLPPTITRRTYDTFIHENYERVRHPNYGLISVYEFGKRKFHIISHRQIRDPRNISLKHVYDLLIVGGKSSKPDTTGST